MAMTEKDTRNYKKCNFSEQLEDQEKNEDGNTDSNYKIDTRCGLSCFHPKWIQKLASKKIYSLALGIFGFATYGEMSAFLGTMSTLEKNFGLSSKLVGSLKTFNQVAGIVGNLLGYAADRGNTIRWISSASFIFFLGCVCFVVPIFSSTSLQNINAHRIRSDNISLILTPDKESSCDNDSNKLGFFKNLIILPFILSQCLLGFGYTIQRTSGLAYLDNNMRRNVFPIWFAGIYTTNWLGYGLGLMMTSFALEFYVFPMSDVNINNSDPRWIGAWWFPSVVFGGVALLLTPIFLLFPQSLPRAAMRNANKKTTPIEKMSCNDFFKSLRSILGNKILMCETISNTMFSLGFLATFWPKYMEIQFGMTPSKSSLMQGLIEFVARPVGMFATSILIMKLKPRPLTLLRSNLAITCLCFVVCMLLVFIGCGNRQIIHGHMDQTNNWDLAEKCNARFNCKNIRFAPVCDKSQIFFSNCHAGCESISIKNNKTIFSNCDCMENSADILEEGLCRPSCVSAFTIYMLLIGLIKTLKAGSRSIKVIVEFRSMKDNEKSFSIGIMRTISALFSTIPANILYGSILDASCLVWDNKCGTRGNCWLYDANKLRYMFFITSSTFMSLSVVLDFLICMYVKSLKIYDEDFIENEFDENKHRGNEEFEQNKLLIKNW